MKRLLSLVFASLLFFLLAPEFASANSSTSLINSLRTHMGTPYVYGGTTPSGFDCSGYIQYVYKKEGHSVPRTTGQQFSTGTSVSKNNLQVGDLVFFNTSGRGVSHVGVYTGSNNFIHASVSKGVMVSSLSDPYYWGSRYIGARRVASFEEKKVAAAPVKKVIYASRGEVAKEIAGTLKLDTSAATATFKDVDKSDPNFAAIAAVAKANIFSGDNGNFKPDSEITREQMAKVLVQAFDLDGTVQANFKDVPADHWATEYIDTLYYHNITTGYGDGTYGLGDKVTAPQLQKFITRIDN
ncbi:C40 family peptidase [Sporosarcina sp.]|uniref:C40 family peptidase n=1 Tax=Sporosarcina sp. TaxID=49982 RepID=UPI002610EEBD|nr:C40 family peptidase [Sporosarcina sp.]